MLALCPRHKAQLNPGADEQHHPPAGHSHGRLRYHEVKCTLNHHMALNFTQHMPVYALCALSALYNFELAWVGGVTQRTGQCAPSAGARGVNAVEMSEKETVWCDRVITTIYAVYISIFSLKQWTK